MNNWTKDEIKNKKLEKSKKAVLNIKSKIYHYYLGTKKVNDKPLFKGFKSLNKAV